MKNYTSIIQKTVMLASLVFVVNCGLQVRDNPISILNPVVPAPEKLYTVGGEASGIKYDPIDIPTGYANQMPDGIVLTINGEEFPINANGEFTFPDKFKDGESYEVSIADNGIVIAHDDGITPPIYLNCDLTNTTGEVNDANVTNVKVDCYLGDTQYKDPWEL